MVEQAPDTPNSRPRDRRRAWIGQMCRQAARGWPLVAPAGVAVALGGVPGFHALDYHACLVLAPIVGICTALRGLRHGGVLLRSTGAVGVHGAALSAELIALVGLPLLIMIGHSSHAPWCDPATGLRFYFWGPALSAAAGLAYAAAALGLTALLGGRSHPAALGSLALVVGASLIGPIGHFLRHPQVFAFHDLVGYVAGALYEDAVEIPEAWPWFRLARGGVHAALIAWLWSNGHALLLPTLRERSSALLRGLGDGRRRTVAVVLATAIAVAGLRGEALGWSVDTDAVVAALPVEAVVSMADPAAGEPRTTLVIHLPAGPDWEGRRQRVVLEAADHLLRLQADLGPGDSRPIEVFLYPTRGSKRRWMGADRVEMAKPWLRQVHMVLPSAGDEVLRHELAHALGAPIAATPLGVPLRHGFMPDAILIEGFAVAAAWPLDGGLDPHQWSHAMRQLGLAPPLSDLFSPAGFLGESGARAYTLAGSLLHWVGEEFGRDALHAAYRSSDLAGATGFELGELARKWGAFVDDPLRAPPTDADMDRAQARFERPGLFFRPCALAVGRCLRRAARHWAGGDPAAGAAELERLWLRVAPWTLGRPASVDLRLDLAVSQARAGDLEPARHAVDALVDPNGDTAAGLTRLMRASVHLTSAGLALQAGDADSARDHWRRVREAPISRQMLRHLDVLEGLVETPAGMQLAAGLLSAGGPWHRPDVLLEIASAALPASPMVAWLATRRLVALGPPGTAVDLLGALLPALEATPGTLRAEATRQIGADLALLGRCELLTALSRSPTAAADATLIRELAISAGRCRRLQAAQPSVSWSGPRLGQIPSAAGDADGAP